MEEKINEDWRKMTPEENSSQTGDGPNTGNSRIKQLMIPEVEFQRIFGERNQKIADLRHDNSFFIYKLYQMHSWADAVRGRATRLLIEAEIKKRATDLKLSQFEKALIAENKLRVWCESRLAIEREELTKIRSALAQAVKDREDSKSQWQRDESRLIKEHLQVTVSLTAVVTRSQKELEAERSLRDKEKLQLQESLRAATQAVDKEKEESSKIRSALAQAVQYTEESKSQWERDESLLIKEHLQVTSRLTEELSRSQEELEEERSLWEQEKLQLKESLRDAKQAVVSLVVQKWREDQVKENQILENPLNEVQKTKPKKKSLFKRFRKFLCCSGTS